MDNVEFVDWQEKLVLHDDELRDHGGQQGFIDEGAVKSAMARAQMTLQLNPDADIADLAADYLFGLATTQGFLDGNKRTALAVTERFLHRNGWRTLIEPNLMYLLVMAVVKREIERDELADVLREHLSELPG